MDDGLEGIALELVVSHEGGYIEQPGVNYWQSWLGYVQWVCR